MNVTDAAQPYAPEAVAITPGGDGHVRGTESPKRRVIAVGGGKGGIGKSLLSANIGVHLTENNQRVVLIDADLGGANLHTCLGMQPPKKTLSDFITRKVPHLADVIAPTPMEGMGLISGALDFLGAANPKYTQKLRLLREIAALEVDYVIIDLGGGTGFNILDFFLIADHGILTVIPEPTSIENAYRFIKAAYYRRLKTLELSWNLRPLVEEAMQNREGHGLQTPADLVKQVAQRDATAGEMLREQLQQFPLKLVINQARSPDEFELGHAISDACRKYFGIPMHFLGAIPFDDAVWRSVRKRSPVLLDDPQAPASEAIRMIATKLAKEEV